VIYLIGGAPKVGKTTVAKNLRERHSALSISTDAIRALVFEITQPSLRADLLPCCVPVTEIGDQFERSVDDWVKSQLREAQTLFPSIIALINYHIRIGEDLILEGVHLVPALVGELLKSNSSADLKTILISARDEVTVLNGFHSKTMGFNWLSRLSEETVKKVAQCVVAYSALLERQAQTLGIKTFQRTDKFDFDVVEMLSLLTKEV
jgi:2-phosphoglycerate kinase